MENRDGGGNGRGGDGKRQRQKQELIVDVYVLFISLLCLGLKVSNKHAQKK